ncbi:MAG: TatD family hydrolase [Nanoarchaeota archaeon]
MNIIDVHAHLEHKDFEKDLDKVIERAKKAGVKKIINAGTMPENNRKSLELSKKFDIIKPSFGILAIDALLANNPELNKKLNFPTAKPFSINKEIEWIEKNKNECVAIGECGLDYFWIQGKENEQKKIFLSMIELAERMNKPIVVHSRKAEQDAIEILETSKIKNVVMHCFMGNKKLIRRSFENGWFFSIPPIIKRLNHFKILTEIVDIKQILTETDSPFLSHSPGERNEPANIAVTIEEIAKIKRITKEEASVQIFGNAKKLFKL